MKENPSVKEIYFWNMAGSFLNALSSVVLLMLVNRMLNIKDSDVFALTFSASQLMATIGVFKVRVFQATDINERYSFTDYYIFRLITSTVMLGVSFVYAYLNHYDGYKMIILFLLCLYKTGDSISDVFQGMFQQKERLDISGKSCALKVVIPTILFFIVVYVTHDLFLSVLSLVISEFILLIYDYYAYKYFNNTYPSTKINMSKLNWKNVLSIFIRCLPLFINSYLITDIFNMPKNMIDVYINRGVFQNGIQTYYNILFMPAFVMSLITIIFRPQLTTMANSKNNGETHKLKKTVLFIVCAMLFCFVLCLGGGYLLGIPILSIIYGTGKVLYGYRLLLMIIICGGGFNALAYIFDDTITIYRKQNYILISYLLAWLFCKFSLGTLMSNFGLNGAAIAYALSMLILMISNAIILFMCIKKEEKESV